MTDKKTSSRTRNSARNAVWGFFYGASTILLPFITRIIILQLLGVHYLGIGTLFTSLLQFLNLAELGIGTAVTYNMYRPIAENNIDELCRILRYIKKMYRGIGLIMLAVGTALVPAVPYLTHGEAPAEINVYILYYIYLINAVISYFFAGYRESLLIAHQRKDVTSRWAMVMNVLVCILQVAILYMTKNIYLFAAVPILGTVATNMMVRRATLKLYPEISPTGELSDTTRQGIRKKLFGLIGTKMNAIVLHSSDTIVISIFLGLAPTAKYGNYYLIFNSVCGFIATLFVSMTASIGDKLVRDSLEKNYQLFRHISFANTWLVVVCSTVFVCLLEPTMSLVYGADMVLGLPFAILMSIYFYVYQIQKTVLTFKDAAGIWYADRYRPYCVMVINLVSNIILVNVIGIHGIVLSTILAFMISLPWLNRTLFKELFHMPSLPHLLTIIKNAVITAAISALSWWCCSFFPQSFLGLIGRGITCLVICNLFFVLLNLRSESLRYWVNNVTSRLNRLRGKKA